jgi:hypothetical protein
VGNDKASCRSWDIAELRGGSNKKLGLDAAATTARSITIATHGDAQHAQQGADETAKENGR